MIETWLLVVTLFLPRIALLIAYLSGQIPPNNIPFIGDLVLYIFLPRLLMIIYIYDNLGWENPWFWIHIVVAILVYTKGSQETYKRKFKR
ncbi:MAG: hypothetical protein N2510_03155 [Ignavibacteria bacterium]|nr:hypothetical protein [Ignavibacteria bacterium]